MVVPLLELPIPHVGDESELAELARRARAGSGAAFEALAARVRDRVRGWATRLTHDHDDAEDVAQLVLLRLHRHVGEFEGRSRFTTWLYYITRNVVISRSVTERRRSGLLSERSPELVQAQEHDATSGTEHDTRQSGDHTAYIARLARACVTELSPKERTVFELSDLRGLNSVEIAHQLGVKPVTVRVLLSKARRRIRLRMLAEHPSLLEDYHP
jgi:RNA polymerase sigma-70 factor (ECF subfamily)